MSDGRTDLVDLLQDASLLQLCQLHCRSRHELPMSPAAEIVAPDDRHYNTHTNGEFSSTEPTLQAQQNCFQAVW